MQHPADEVDIGPGVPADPLEQRAGQLHRLDLVHFPAEDLPAPHVDDEVQIEVLPAHVALSSGT
jgi:hypothetical protein